MEDAAKRFQQMNFLQMNSIGDLMVNIIMVGVFAAVGEEILFRGVIQNMLTNWLQKPWVAMLLYIVFVFIHFQFYRFFPRMALGAVLASLLLLSKPLGAYSHALFKQQLTSSDGLFLSKQNDPNRYQ